MIPKHIHYCWFGGSKPQAVTNQIEQWKRMLPEYEFFEWNETSFDIDQFRFTKEAYSAQKYAFVSDAVRLWAMYTYGGFYLDVDFEIRKTFDSLCKYDLMVGLGSAVTLSAFFGAKAGQEVIGNILDFYQNEPFFLSSKHQNIGTVNYRITKEVYNKYGYFIGKHASASPHFYDPNDNVVVLPNECTERDTEFAYVVLHQGDSSWNQGNFLDDIFSRIYSILPVKMHFKLWLLISYLADTWRYKHKEVN